MSEWKKLCDWLNKGLKLKSPLIPESFKEQSLKFLKFGYESNQIFLNRLRVSKWRENQDNAEKKAKRDKEIRSNKKTH